MSEITYLIYIVFWESMTIGGASYVVFWLNYSGWWILVGLFMSGCAYKPERWIHGKEKNSAN